MKLHNISPVSTGKIDVALAAMRPLAPPQLEKLGAQLFADAINYPNIPLSTTAKHLSTVASQLGYQQRDQLIRGFFGTADTAAASKAIEVFEAKVASATPRSDGTLVCQLRSRHGELYASDRTALAARLAGQTAEFYAGSPKLVEAPGSTKAKPLTKGQKEALMAELDRRFDGIKDATVKGGVLELTVGAAFREYVGEALERAVRKFVGDVPFKTVFDAKGDKPAFELSQAGLFTKWVDGQSRVPLIETREAAAAAMSRLGDERVADLYTSTDQRSLTVRLAAWATKADAEQVMKKVSKTLDADAVHVIVDSGVAYTSGDAPTDSKVWEMSPAEATKATKAAQKIDASVAYVGIGTTAATGHLTTYSTAHGGSGNTMVIGVGTLFDMKKADALFAAVQKSLGVDDTVPMVLQRSESGVLASVGVRERKDEYLGLRDGDT